MSKNDKIVKTKAALNEIKNLYRDMLVLDKKIGTNKDS